MSTFPQTSNHSWSCSTSILEGAIFHKMSYCKISKVILARPSRPFYRCDCLPLGLRVLDGFRSLCRMKEFGDRFDVVTFPRLFITWRKLQLSPFRSLPVGFPLPTISKNSSNTLFSVPDSWPRRSLSKFPFLAPKFLFRMSCRILFFTRAFNLWKSSPNFFWWVSRSYKFQYGLEFFRLSYSYFAQSFQDVMIRDFVIDNKIRPT